MEVYNHYEINNMRQDAIRRSKEMQRRSNNNHNNMGTQNQNKSANPSNNPNNLGMKNHNRQPNPQGNSFNSGVQNQNKAMNTGYNYNNPNEKKQNKEAEPSRYGNPYPFGYYGRRGSNNINSANNESSKHQTDNNHSRKLSQNTNKNYGFYGGTAHGKSFPYNKKENIHEQVEEEGRKVEKEPPVSINNLLGGVLNNFLYDSQGKIDTEKLLVIGLIFLLAKEGVDIKLLLALGYILI